jgi:hypothetical protein
MMIRILFCVVILVAATVATVQQLQVDSVTVDTVGGDKEPVPPPMAAFKSTPPAPLFFPPFEQSIFRIQLG